MKLLAVDHNALETSQRALYERLCTDGRIQLMVVVPSRWHNNYRMLRFVAPNQSLPYELIPSKVLFPSRTHRLVYLLLSKLLSEFQPDILYMNAEPENFQTFHAALLCKRAKTKLVFSSWRNIDHVQIGYPYKLSILHRRMEEFVLGQAAHGIVFNPTAKDIYAQHGFHRTTFIPPWADLRLVEQECGERRSGPFTLGYVGRLAKAKGVDIILHAMVHLPDEFRLVIVGDGPERKNLGALAHRLGLSHRIDVRGAIAAESVSDVFRGIDALVLPSRSTRYWREQFGRVLIEGMACGVPVIGSSCGEIPFVIDDAGLVFEEENSESLRACIARVASDAELRRIFHDRGIARVKRLFSAEIVAKQYHDLLFSL